MRKIIVGSDITIKNASASIIKALERRLTIPNPQYNLLKNMNRSTWGISETYTMYKRVGNDFVIPFGAVSDKHVRKHLVGYKFERESFKENRIYLKGKIELYDYQEKAMKFMTTQHRGILKAPTASGKTNIGLYMIKELGLRALWITHTMDLLYQSRDRAKEVFHNVDVGYITGGKVDIGKDITFATVQTLHKVIDSVKDEFNVIVIDEVHRCIGSPTMITMFYNAVNKLNAQYKFGLTATPERPDGLHRMTYSLIGNVAYEIPVEDVKRRVLPVVFEVIKNEKKYDIQNYTDVSGMINPTGLAQMLYYDKDRNKLISDKAKELVSGGSGGVLILTKYVKQAEFINEQLQDLNIDSGLLVGRISKKRREEILACENTQVIIATSSLAKEGLDIPRYEHLILAYPVTNKGEFTQTAGRVRRVFGDKRFGYVFEVQDVDIEFLRKRVHRHYKWARDLNL